MHEWLLDQKYFLEIFLSLTSFSAYNQEIRLVPAQLCYLQDMDYFGHETGMSDFGGKSFLGNILIIQHLWLLDSPYLV